MSGTSPTFVPHRDRSGARWLFGLAFAAAAGPLAVFAAQPLQSAVPTANPAEPPAGVAGRVSDRRITVSWDAVSGGGGLRSRRQAG